MTNGQKPSPHKRATIKDVAELAGVSIKTVSRVVRQEPNVSKKTRKIVENVVQELNYRPTLAARSSVGDRSFLLGLLFDNPNPSYTSDLIKASLRQANKDGFHMVVEPVDANHDDIAVQVENLVVQSNLAGLILPPPLSDRIDILDAIHGTGRPVARLAPSTEWAHGIDVHTNDFEAVRMIIEHLIKFGHRRIAFVSGRANSATTQRRFDGYKSALQEHGIAFDEQLVLPGNYLYRSGLDAGENILNMAIRPTAIFACNDDMAAGVISAVHKSGLSIPADISVAGFDDSVVASIIWPALTTVKQPIQEMVSRAVHEVVKRTRHPDAPLPAPLKIPCDLVLRESTGIAT